MEHKSIKRFLSAVMAFVMLLSLLPLGGLNVFAEETTTVWDFSSADFIASTGNSYNGLTWTNGKSHNDTYLYSGTGTISVPVSGPSDIAVSACYEYSFYFESENEASVGQKTGSTSQIDTYSYSYNGEAGTVDITVLGGSYLTKIEVTPKPVIEVPEYDSSMIDVWDFGAEQLDSSKYNNMLNVDEINSWFPDKDPGTTGVTTGGFVSSDGQLEFNGGGKVNHRLRSTNEALTRYDNKSLTDANGNAYNGYIYSNAGSNTGVYVAVTLYAGDKVTYAIGSNGGSSTIHFEGPNGVEATQVFDGAGAKIQLMDFYPSQTGVYKVYSSDEKLVVARIYREHSDAVTVSGTVSAPETLTGYSLVFTNTLSGATVAVPVENGSYSATLFEGYTYDLSLADANGYVIVSEQALSIADGAESATADVTVAQVDLVTVTGSITGLGVEALAKAQLSFKADAIYNPVITVSGSTYTAILEKGVTYEVVVSGVNDYVLTSAASVSYDADTAADITMEAKPVYAVTVEPIGATLADLAEAVFTFTNLNEEGYVYTFTGTEGIALRDGVYSVKVTNSGAYVQQLTANVKVNGAAVTRTIPFSSDITVWDFSAEDFTGENGTYNNLTWTAGTKNKTYLLANAGTISVPVKGSCQILVSGCYQYSFYFASEDEASVGQKTGSTSQIDTFAYSYNGGAGTVDITVLGQSYLTKIEVLEVVEYKDTLTVGASGCDFTTIAAAVEAVASMDRPNGERVTILIQPGNYEEMLVINTPNITLKNASENPSIELTDKGVGIDANAVRITHYYGCGYNYFSMNSSCKYDENVLAVNKENGYTDFVNPGDGSGSDSYWNATVIVKASGFQAEGIIFENSFNQYVSEKAANDVIIPNSECKEGSVTRGDLPAGSTDVQDKAYVERAAALAIIDGIKEVYFENCKFIGRQDTLYGGKNATVAFYDCSIYGACDYIFGGMTAVFAKCDLVFNTSENGNDVGYITASQTPEGNRGYLMYNCTVTSTVPGVDTASEFTSKPGYLGRPWAANTGEAVFYNTVIEASDTHWYDLSASLIREAGWLSSLSGESAMCGEFGTYEYAKDVDNTDKRVSWASKFEGEVLSDGSAITVETFLGEWDPFVGKDMTIVIPTEKVDNKPVEEEEPSEGEPAEYNFDSLVDVTPGADKDVIAAGTTYADGYFKVVGSVTQRFQESKGGVYAIEIAKNGTGAIEFMVSGKGDVTITVASTGSSNTSAVAIIDAQGNVIANNEAITEVTGTGSTKLTYTGLEAGTYQIVSPQSDYNRGFRLMTINVVDTPAVVVTEYTFDSLVDVKLEGEDATKDKAVVPAGSTYADNYFKIVGSVTQRWQESKGGTYAIEIGKNGTGAMEFTVNGSADVTITVASTGSSNTSAVAIIDAQGNVIANNEAITEVTGTGSTKLTYTGLEAGTYQIVSPQSDYNRGFRLMTVNVVQTSSGERPARLDWAQVADPVIVDAKQNGGSIDVTYEMVIGYDGADSVTVELYNGAGTLIDSKSVADSGTGATVSFTPAASGSYAVRVIASRLDETDKVVARAVEDFVLPLATPIISSATSVGGGKVSVVWESVAEADSYNVYCDGQLVANVTESEYTVSGLTVGTKYSFTLEALRGSEVSAVSAAVEATVTENAQRVWGFTAYGSSTSTSSNGYVGSLVDDGYVTVYSEGGKGKIVPNSTDGVAFYYTAIPTEENFTLRAKIHVDSWTLSNGQEGFGMLATDRLGNNGSSASFWNNSYMAAVTKNEYRYDKATDTYYPTSSSLGQKYSMRLGITSIEKTGVTPANLPLLEVNDSNTVTNEFSSVSNTLENYAAFEADISNIVGNATNAVSGTCANPITDFVMEIQKNNTGYFITYYDLEGNVVRKIKHYNPDALSILDTEFVYVGFFAARNARITVSDVELTTILATEDAPAEEKPVTYITPTNAITSAAVANTDSYTLYVNTNVNGTVDISVAGQSVAQLNAVGGQRLEYVISLKPNTATKITAVFTPDPDQDLGEDTKLSSTDPITAEITVTYSTSYSAQKNLYVSPNGKSTNTGYYQSPLDIFTAVSVVQPGQTIILMEGTYLMAGELRIQQGIDGTSDMPIRMIADPNAESRPVLDFQKRHAGFVHGGDYWYFFGFDVTNSAPGQKGMQISGHYNVVDQINTYNNGNTGLQISRWGSSVPTAEWPHDNLILNCTSYNNADPGHEDADGFAAKLNCGEGNVFDGCVAYNNADDGWDLYAKVESGPIGAVTIRNCVAYQNGYVWENGELVKAGNGNGFKMGGESIPGKHKLINSYAFFNKAKGFDSNSCPDIIVENSISYNNESYNVAFYTNNAANTDFAATGIISFKDSSIKGGLEIGENFKFKGTQDESKVYGTTNYYWDGSKSANTAGAQVTADWFVSLQFKGVERNADGTINLQGFLELTDKAAANAGARPDGTATTEQTVELDNPFPDVQGSNQFMDYVMWGYYNNIVGGKRNGTFDGNGVVTRGQFIIMLWRAAGCPEPTEYKSFPDVTENSTFYKAVCWAVEKGITNGKKDGTFGVNDECTRGHVALFLYRYAGSPEVSGNGSFGDVTGGTYYNAVCWLAETGITSGQSDGNFGVSNTCKRFHAMKFLYLFLN